MTLATTEQKGCIGTLVSKMNLQGEKKDMVMGFTAGRTDTTTKMTIDEATAMIRHLKTLEPGYKKAEAMRRKIISMAHEMGWRVERNGKMKADMRRIDNWCIDYGYKHKKLNQYTLEQLPHLVTAFEQMHLKFIKGL